MSKKNKWSFFVCLLIIGYAVSYPFLNVWANSLTWDGFGYYIYLPLTFVYGDLGITDISIIEDINKEYNVSSTLYQFYITEKGYWITRYPMGIAVMQSPFYLTAHLLAPALGYKADGISTPYQVSLILGGLFYFSSAIFLLRKILLYWFKDSIVAIALITLYFATNLENQSVLSTAMPHILIFFLYAVIVWYTIQWHTKPTVLNSLILGSAIGIITICRATEIISVLIPVFWGLKNPLHLIKKIKQQFKSNTKYIGLVVLSTFGFIFLQMLYWKMFEGHFIINSYKNNLGEGLDFATPYLYNVLFSFRKGWFIYTPIIIFFILGFIWLRKKKTEFFWSFFLFFIFNVYLIACWTNWWYAASFGQRAMIHSYIVLTIVFCFFLEFLSKKGIIVKSISALLLFLFIGLNLFQSWQYKEGILHSSRMTFDYYSKIFLKTERLDEKYNSLLTFDYDMPFERALKMYEHKERVIFLNDFENELSDTAYVSKGALLIDGSYEHTKPFSTKYRDITEKEWIWIKTEFMCYSTGYEGEINLQSAIERKEGIYGYQADNIYKSIDSTEINQWKKITYYYRVPHIRNKNDLFRSNFWIRETKGKIWIDNLVITAYYPK